MQNKLHERLDFLKYFRYTRIMANKKDNYKVTYKVIDIDGRTKKTLWETQVEAVSAVKAIKLGAVELKKFYGIEAALSKATAYGRGFALAHATGSGFSPNNVVTAAVTHDRPPLHALAAMRFVWPNRA